MKLKKINKKLVLKKETITSLADEDLKKINGGATRSCICGDPSFLSKCETW